MPSVPISYELILQNGKSSFYEHGFISICISMTPVHTSTHLVPVHKHTRTPFCCLAVFEQ